MQTFLVFFGTMPYTRQLFDGQHLTHFLNPPQKCPQGSDLLLKTRRIAKKRVDDFEAFAHSPTRRKKALVCAALHID